jgi:putative N-acetyltransferase (TIGR04045 family)
VSATHSLSIRRVDANRSLAVACRVARSTEELARHFAIRRAVFVDEQALFAGDDADDRDDRPATIHVVGAADGLTGGAVRLYPLDAAGLWQGDRLAVLPAFRHGMLGAALVRYAVETAGRLGGHRMVAQIQLPNVRFFELLGWRRDGDAGPYHGVDHQPMSIPLGGALSPRAR